MNRKTHADIIDVANAAGVSPATVSRSFNHPAKVHPATRKRIVDAVAETGYIRNRAAQAIHGIRSGTVGLIVPTLDNSIFSALIQALADGLKDEGLTVLLATHGYDLDEEYNLLRKLLEHRIEGVALIGVEHSQETRILLDRRKVPVVTMWNFDAKSSLPCVGADNVEAGKIIAQYICDLGHRDVALMLPRHDGNDRAGGRLNGILSVLARHDATPVPDWNLDCAYSVKQARSLAFDLLNAPKRPTAIIAGNDIIAQGCIYAAQSLGMKVPQDISVSGIGDFAGSADLEPGLTTVRLRPNTVGRVAAKLLASQITSDPSTEIARIATELELKIRASTAPLKRLGRADRSNHVQDRF